jgi:hypothetical protein
MVVRLTLDALRATLYKERRKDMEEAVDSSLPL